MQYVYLGLFILSTGLHLYGSYKDDRLFRGSTKGIILIAILGYYVSMVETPSWLLVAALLTSWVGDMFLIPSKMKYFIIGGCSFWVSHGFFIAEYCKSIDFSKVPIWFIVSSIIVFVTAACWTFSRFKKDVPGPLFYIMLAYLATNGVMNCFALFRLWTNPCLATIVTAIGALGFFISDNAVFTKRFKKETKIKKHILIMATYSLGEFLIILGLVL